MDRVISKIFLLAMLAIVGKLMENAKKMGSPKKNLKTFYEAFNVHLSFSLGILGLAWTQDIPSDVTLIIVLFMMLGVFSKGVLSEHEPESWHYSD